MTLVFLEHLLMPLLTRSGANITDWVNPGRMGVIIFFAVSGFVIPLSVRKSENWKDFLLGRFCRLYPAYWLSLLVHLVLYQLGSRSVSAQGSEGLLVWVVNMSMLQMFFGFKNINLVAWTLGLEWIIYLAAIGMIQLKAKLNPLRLLWSSTFVLAILAIFVPLVLHKRIPVAAPQCLIAALFGYALLLAVDSVLTSRTWAFYALLNLISQLLAATVNYQLFPKADAEIPFSAIIVSIGLAYLGFCALFQFRKVAFPSVVTWVGKISYSIYLFHGLVIYFCVQAVPGAGGMILSLALTLLFGALLYQYVEAPFQSLGFRLRRKGRFRPVD